MKVFYNPSKSLVLVALACFFTFPLFSQTICQKVFPKIKNSIPAIIPADTGWIDLCLGDTLKLIGEGIYPQNDSTYHQSDSTSIFTWLFGDGKKKQGKSIAYVYTKPGAYYLQLSITDREGCKNDTNLLQRVRVKPKPNALFANDRNTSWQFCNEDTIQAIFTLPKPNTFSFTAVNTYADTVFLPDGDGIAYETAIAVAGFPQQAIVTTPQDLETICLNIEHSWLRDLVLTITCPNGQSAILHNFGGRGGSETYLGEPIDFDGNVPIPGIGYDYCWTMNATNGTWLEYANTFRPRFLPAGDYKPFESFDSLIGCPINGEWRLKVEDLWKIDNGTLFGWNIQFSNAVFGNDRPETFISTIENYQLLPNPAIFQQLNDTFLLAIRDSIAPLIVKTTDNFGCTFEQERPIITYPEGHPFCQSCDSLQIAITGDTIRCPEFKTTLRVRANVPDSILQFKWLDNQGNIISTARTFIVIGKSDAYFVEVTNSVNGCTRRDTVQLLVASEFPIANSGDNVSICWRDSVQLDGSLSDQRFGIRYGWSGSSILGDTSTAKIWVDSAGIYVLTVQNTISGCISRDTVQVLPLISFDVATTTAACDTTTGTAAIELQNELSDYTISWSTGETGDSIQNLAQGWYSVMVTSGGCSIHKNFYVDEDRSCKVTISGYVYNSPNCEKTPQTQGVGNLLLQLLPANIYTYTKPNGYYEFVTDAGAYTVKFVDNDIYEIICPQDGIIQIDTLENGETARDSNFFVRRIPKPNLKVDASMSATRPGFDAQVNLQVCNVGNTPTDVVLEFVHDSLLLDKTLSSIANTYNLTTRTATWELSNLKINECRRFTFELVVSQNAPLNTVLQNVASALLAGDIHPENNRFVLSQPVTGSFDPNDKQLLNAKNTFGGPIFEQDSILQYQIRFQNTGTDTAFTVVIRDTIDANLQVESIRPGIASHDYTLQFEGKNVLIFNFENILLPDSVRNEPGSHGFVTYSIETKRNLTFGDTIQNGAAIYFDYNKPVITNTVENIFTKTTTVWTIGKHGAGLRLSPNPTVGALTIEWNLPYASATTLTISNANGQVVRKLLASQRYTAGTHRLSANLENLEAGVYFLILETQQERITSKVVKLK